MSAVGLRETLWLAAWFGREAVVKGDSPRRCECSRESGHQAVWWHQDRMCLALWLLLHMVWSELSLGYCPPFSSFHKFLQMDSLSSMTHQRLLFEPILNLGVWQMALPILGQCVCSSLFCALFILHTLQIVGRVTYFMQILQWEKKSRFWRGHIWWSNN